MTEFQRLVNTMSNKQRNRWAKAKYPGLRQEDIEKLKPFVNPAHSGSVQTPLDEDNK